MSVTEVDSLAVGSLACDRPAERDSGEAAEQCEADGDSDELRQERNNQLVPADHNLGDMTVDEQYEFAELYKAAGNIYFQEGRLAWALKNYSETITFLKLTEGIHVNKQEYNAALAMCDKALSLDPSATERTKLLYRRGEALLKLGSCRAAVEELQRAAKLAPNDAKVRAKLLEARTVLNSIHQEELSVARQVFGGKFAQKVVPADSCTHPASESAHQGQTQKLNMASEVSARLPKTRTLWNRICQTLLPMALLCKWYVWLTKLVLPGTTYKQA
eukprot:jgi/Chlat1/1697/Chrsp127S01932